MDFRTWRRPIYGNLNEFHLSTWIKQLISIGIANGLPIAFNAIARDAYALDWAHAINKFPAAESISFEILPQPECNVLIHFFQDEGHFREASDWLSHGKPSDRMAFLFGVQQAATGAAPGKARLPSRIISPKGCASNPLSGPNSGSSISFAYRAADATPVFREARRDSRESESPPGVSLRRLRQSEEKPTGCEG